jgi:GNAT superfamily N-acetyltransferase
VTFCCGVANIGLFKPKAEIQMSENAENLRNLLEDAEAEYLFDRVSALLEMPSNPYGADVFGNLNQRRFLVAKSTSPMNNRICGFDIDGDKLPTEEISRFAQAGATVHLPVIGAPKDIKKRAEDFGIRALRGWTQGQFCAELKDLPESDGTDRTRLLTADGLDDFVKIHSGAFRYSGANLDITLYMIRGLLSQGRAEAYAVDEDGAPVAIGLIYFATNQTGYLATAATTRAARKRGAHSALISRRIEAARENGCKRVSSIALLSSQSCRNLKRAGLYQSHVQSLLVLQ